MPAHVISRRDALQIILIQVNQAVKKAVMFVRKVTPVPVVGNVVNLQTARQVTAQPIKA